VLTVSAIGDRYDSGVRERMRQPSPAVCPKDSTRWDAKWSCLCNDRCPRCGGVTEPYATTDNRTQAETIHNQEVYDRANAVEQ
jgi:hypothetical protein